MTFLVYFKSPITVKVGNSATGTRTVRVGRLFTRAMSDASAERANEVRSAKMLTL